MARRNAEFFSVAFDKPSEENVMQQITCFDIHAVSGGNPPPMCEPSAFISSSVQGMVGGAIGGAFAGGIGAVPGGILGLIGGYSAQTILCLGNTIIEN